MKVSFDQFNRYEIPQLTLCNPGSKATVWEEKINLTGPVGLLSDPIGLRLKLNFNAPHELAFSYAKHTAKSAAAQTQYQELYDSIETGRCVYMDDMGYFIITATEESDEDRIFTKSVTCRSCEIELEAYEGLFLEEGAYPLHTEDGKGLIDDVIAACPGWTLGYIDPDLLSKTFYFAAVTPENAYRFLYETLQEAAECIVEADILLRKIHVYSRAHYAQQHITDIHLARHNLLQYKNTEENDEDKWTALNVYGGNDLNILFVNPIGGNTIYNFEPRYRWMSPPLQDAIERWMETIDAVTDRYVALGAGFYAAQDALLTSEAALADRQEQMRILLQERDNIAQLLTQCSADQKAQYQTALNNKNTEIRAAQTAIDTAKKALQQQRANMKTQYEDPIAEINAQCALATTARDTGGAVIFTPALLQELAYHIKPTDYNDPYTTVTESMTNGQKFQQAKTLLARAKSQLIKISSGRRTYTIRTNSFLFNRKFERFSEQLTAGAILYVETESDKMEQLHLTGIDIDFAEKTTAFTLGNKYNRSDLQQLFDDTLGSHSKTAASLQYIAGLIEDQKNRLNTHNDWIAALQTLTLDHVLTSDDQTVVIDNRGLLSRARMKDENGNPREDVNGNPLFEAEQCKLMNGGLYITGDNWNHLEAAIGRIAVGYNTDGTVKYDYGVIGNTVIGKLLLGEKLALLGGTEKNGSYSITLDQNGLVIVNDGSSAGLTIKNAANVRQFYADANGNLCIQGNIVATSGTFNGTVNAIDGNLGGWILKRGQLYAKDSSNRYCGIGLSGTAYAFSAGATKLDGSDGVFRVNHSGVLTATNADIHGTITANAGKIGNLTLINYKLFYTANASNPWVSGLNGYYHINSGNTIFLWAGAQANGISPTNAREIFGRENWSEAKQIIENTARFYVTQDGFLRCKEANISGAINATSGKIGNWTISNGNLQYGNLASGMVIFEPNYLKAAAPGDTIEEARWYDIVFCANSWVSDATVKNTIESIDQKFEAFFNNLKPKTFFYNKNFRPNTYHKLHFGFVAQDILNAIIESGYDDLAMVWKNDIYKIDKQEIIALNTWQIQKIKSRLDKIEAYLYSS